MLKSHVVRRTLIVIAATVALAAVAFGATGCDSQTKAAAPTTTPVAVIGAPSGTNLVAQSSGGMHGTAKTAPPLSDEGKTVIEKNCLKAGCHNEKLLSYRATPDQSKTIVTEMAPKAKLTDDQMSAVADYFAQ